MSKLLIIRHGQASFGAADYDQLSPLGYQQSRNLGAWAARFGLPISHLVIGPRLRHRQTAEAMLEGMGSAAPLAAKDVSPAPIWDEFPAFEVIAHGLPRLIKTLPPEMARAYSEAALDPKGQRETFEKMFRHTIRAWVVGELDVPECETYADFHQRIRTAIHNLMAEHGRCPHVTNMFENTRTTFTNRLVRFLAWNMPFHIEHHTMPTVPFHKLPALNELTREHLKATSNGYSEFHKEYVETLA